MVLKIIIGAVVVFLAVWAWKIRIYLKWQKKAKANVAPFYRFPERKGLARIKAESDPEEVWCNLGMCQCATYKADHRPCKHIYKIALMKGLI